MGLMSGNDMRKRSCGIFSGTCLCPLCLRIMHEIKIYSHRWRVLTGVSRKRWRRDEHHYISSDAMRNDDHRCPAVHFRRHLCGRSFPLPGETGQNPSSVKIHFLFCSVGVVEKKPSFNVFFFYSGLHLVPVSVLHGVLEMKPGKQARHPPTHTL